MSPRCPEQFLAMHYWPEIVLRIGVSWGHMRNWNKTGIKKQHKPEKRPEQFLAMQYWTEIVLLVEALFGFMRNWNRKGDMV